MVCSAVLTNSSKMESHLGDVMDSKKLIGVLVSLLVGILMFWLNRLHNQLDEMHQMLDILQDRTARSEEAEFYIKESLQRIEAKVDQ